MQNKDDIEQELEFSDDTSGLIGGGVVIAENYRDATGGEIYEYVPIHGGPKYYKYTYVWTDEGYTMDMDRSRIYINGLVVTDEPTRD